MHLISTVLVADNHSIMRLGTSVLVKEILPGASVLHSSTFEETINLTNIRKPDLILLEIDIPGGGNTDMVSVLKLRHKHASILMFTNYDEQIFGLRYIHAGADGFLTKKTSHEVFKQAVRKVLNKEKYISEELRNKYINQLFSKSEVKTDPLTSLSNRELDIARMLIKGVNPKQIAQILNLHISTVSTYKSRVFEKLNVNNIIALAEKIEPYRKEIS